MTLAGITTRTWCGYGHPCQRPAACRTCWLEDMTSRQVLEWGEPHLYADRVEVRDEWRGREAEANEYVDEERDDMNAPGSWSQATLAYRAREEAKDRPRAKLVDGDFDLGKRRIFGALAEARENLAFHHTGDGDDYAERADARVGHTSREVPAFNERREHTLNVLGFTGSARDGGIYLFGQRLDDEGSTRGVDAKGRMFYGADDGLNGEWMA